MVKMIHVYIDFTKVTYCRHFCQWLEYSKYIEQDLDKIRGWAEQ